MAKKQELQNRVAELTQDNENLRAKVGHLEDVLWQSLGDLFDGLDLKVVRIDENESQHALANPMIETA
jgi:hypothetical protein